MTRIGTAARFFARSLAGRIALILAVGMSCASIGSLLVAEQARRLDIAHIQAGRVIATAIDLAGRLQRDPEGTRRSLDADQILGARRVDPKLALHGDVDPLLNAGLIMRLGAAAQSRIVQVPGTICFMWRNLPKDRTVGLANIPMPDCWIVSFVDGGGVQQTLAIDLLPIQIPPSSILNAVYLVLIVVTSALLSILVAGVATAPLRRLTEAAQAFARSIDAEPIPERGPPDVRTALATFNVMQARVREGLRERTRLLAAISHDLQTPLTRLRLRLEQVDDEALRERLVADLSATLTMVRRGLDLARSGESIEDWSTVDLDSMLSSIAEDAADVGQAVRFTGGCGASIRTRPDALSRCIGNLIDNALKYAGDAEISCHQRQQNVVISVRDHGPGVSYDLIDKIFQPFFRGAPGEASTAGGSGIGLTIAKAQAAACGGDVSLYNHDEGGLVATLVVPAITRHGGA